MWVGNYAEILEQSDGHFVDVHNYLILQLPEGEMTVDATWPLSTLGMGTVVNESFVFGENQRIASEPKDTWIVPEDHDPQEYKNEILASNFTPAELEHREAFLKTIFMTTSSE